MITQLMRRVHAFEQWLIVQNFIIVDVNAANSLVLSEDKYGV